MSRAKLHLIDGSGYIYRAFYAIRNLSTSAGEPINAVHGFSQMLEKTLRDEQPTHIVMVFDTGKPSFRNEIYADYKANRDAPPEELVQQIPKIQELVRCFRIPTFAAEGFEADDVIASLTRRAIEANFDVRIISGDKDLMQLVSDRVTQWEPMKGKNFGPLEVEAFERLLVSPQRVKDALALAGDASDNIPGVRGIGPKKAAKLIADFGDLESILSAAQAGKIKGKMGQILAESMEDARLSLRLVTLEDQVELAAVGSMDDLCYPGPDKEALQELYKRFEFRRSRVAVDSPNSSKETGGGVSAEDVKPVVVDMSRTRDRIIIDEVGLRELAQELEGESRMAVALELSSLRLIDAEWMGVSIYWASSCAAYIPLGHLGEQNQEQISIEIFLDVLGPLFGRPQLKKISSDCKQLCGMLIRHGWSLRGLVFDPSLAAYLLAPDTSEVGTEFLAKRYLNHEPISRTQLLGTAKKKRLFSRVPVEDAAKYASERAQIMWHSTEVLGEALKKTELFDVLQDIELPLVPVLARIELGGMLVDLDHLQHLKGRFEQELGQLEATCYEAAGREFTIGSPKQLRTILYEELGLKITKRTKTGPSTDHSALEAIAHEHPLPKAVIDYREIQKLQNTYVESLPKMCVPSSGRVHTQLHQAIAATGRLSSAEPNLQNIPIRTTLGRELRKAFVASSARVLISVDYSQIELRVLAHLANDELLVRAFEDHADVHTRTASALFDVPEGEVTREQRTQAKAVNFGVLYGMKSVRLARELQIPRRRAAQFIDDYFARQPGVYKFMEETLEQARAQGMVRTLLGRRRLVPDIGTSNRSAREAAERIAKNTPIQGSAADLIKMAMLRVDALLRDAYQEAQLVLQVHDELVIEAREDEAEAIAEEVKVAMQRVYPLRVPLVANAHIGKNWDEAH
ncbi:MAG: DNA polymerase I [Myxococcales bacterium]|nr:DNA polymerase I [Myxococcales bacterium]